MDKILCAVGGAAAAAALLAGVICYVVYRFRVSTLMLRMNSEYGERRNGKSHEHSRR